MTVEEKTVQIKHCFIISSHFDTRLRNEKTNLWQDFLFINSLYKITFYYMTNYCIFLMLLTNIFKRFIKTMMYQRIS